MRRNYIVNSIFAIILLFFFMLVKFTGYFSAAFLKDDFFYGAIILPVCIGFSIFSLVWVILNIKESGWANRLTIVISIITTIVISLFLSLLPYIFLLFGTGLECLLFGIVISLILFNVCIVEFEGYNQRR